MLVQQSVGIAAVTFGLVSPRVAWAAILALEAKGVGHIMFWSSSMCSLFCVRGEMGHDDN